MKLIAKGATVWLRRGRLKNMCGGAEVVDDPIFEPDAGLGDGTETETTETSETIEAIETTTVDAIISDDSDSDDEPFEEAEIAEPEDDSDLGGGMGWGSDVDLGALAGLGVGAQGGNTRLTFDLVIDCGWRLLDSVSVGARLFLHGTPGVGYGFGGLTAEVRYFLPRFGSIEPYAQAGLGGGYGAAGTTTGVFVARLSGGGRMAVWDRLFVSGELVIIISQISFAGGLDVGLGWSF
jgi:hypothetical protein